MKKTLYTVIAAMAALALTASCAKNGSETDTYESSKRVLDAWMKIYHPDIQPSGRGIYVLESTEGSGSALDDSTTFAFIDYDILDLEGNYIESTSSKTNKQLGTFNSSYYYGPAVRARKVGVLYAGLEDMLDMMKVGGYMEAVIPSWFINTKVYDNVESYYRNDNGGGHYIYRVWLRDATKDIEQWEIDSLERFSNKYYDGLDSTKYGFYYKVKKAGPGDTIPSDSTVYIRYVGKLLNGHVFDTNIKDTAVKYGIYDSSKDYDTPAKVTMAEKASSITLDGASIISGFGETLKKMKAEEEAESFFYSTLGYGSNGSGKSIPAFAPLYFYIQLVPYEEE